MSAAERAFVLAQGYELICAAGKNDAEFVKKASDQYKEAQRLNPDRMAVLQRRAVFLFNRDPAAAEEVLRHMLKLDPRSSTARQMLAALLAVARRRKRLAGSRRSCSRPPASRRRPTNKGCRPPCWRSRGGKENLLKARQNPGKPHRRYAEKHSRRQPAPGRAAGGRGQDRPCPATVFGRCQSPRRRPNASGAVRRRSCCGTTWARMRPPGSRNCGSNCPTTWAFATCTPVGSTPSTATPRSSRRSKPSRNGS